MWYVILFGVFAAWILFDGLSRKHGGAAFAWALGTLFLGPLLVPVYLAKRPLKNGEFRIGDLPGIY
jgi:membrane associated rhomboid family serine protease